MIKDVKDSTIWVSLYFAGSLVTLALFELRNTFIPLRGVLASQKLHNSMLENILGTTRQFHDITPPGQILNRSMLG